MYLIFTDYIEKLYTCKNGTDGQGKTIQFSNYTNFYKDDIVVFFGKYLILYLPSNAKEILYLLNVCSILYKARISSVRFANQ